MKRFVLLFCVALACTGPVAAEGTGPAPREALVAANTAFAWDLYDALRAGDANLFFSPYSVSTALTMTREGARGRTAVQMDKVLHLGRLARARAYSDLVRALLAPQVREGYGERATKQPAYVMTVANRLWGQARYAFEDAFTASMEKVYEAPLARIDFRDSAGARRKINAWVAQRTQDKIRDIVPAGMPPPLTRLVLANAIYFKARWQNPFYERLTEDADFTGPNGKQTKAPFMRRVARHRYGEADGVQVLEIPYRSGRASMVVFLPRAKDGLKAVEDKLVQGAAAGWIAKLGFRQVDVRLPKFKFTCSQDLTSTLPRMGMTDAFQLSKADFSGMTKVEKLCIGAVLHKAFIAVDEKGTEAAAATVVMMKAGAAPSPAQPVEFRADHPFAFVIRHRATGSILFAGRLNTP